MHQLGRIWIESDIDIDIVINILEADNIFFWKCHSSYGWEKHQVSKVWIESDIDNDIVINILGSRQYLFFWKSGLPV